MQKQSKTVSARIDGSIEDRIEAVCKAVSEQKFVEMSKSQAIRLAIQRGLSLLEAELGIAGRLDHYAYRVRYDMDLRSYIATCDEFPDVRWKASSEYLALLGVREQVREQLEQLEEKGEPVPRFRRPCSASGCKEEATMWCTCLKCQRIPVTTRRFHACTNHMLDVDAQHTRFAGWVGMWLGSPEDPEGKKE